MEWAPTPDESPDNQNQKINESFRSSSTPNGNQITITTRNRRKTPFTKRVTLK